jgi:hypothetical protein
MAADERRRFPRLDVPLYYRPGRLFGPRRVARDVSRGGIRVYTDDALEVGTRLEIELFLREGDSLTLDVRVAWLRELVAEDARYEAGLEFLTMDDERIALLERCLAEYKS